METKARNSSTIIPFVIDLLFPRRCPLCGDIVVPRGELSCVSCREKLQMIEEPRCKKCSKPIESFEAEYCYDCHRKSHHYKRGFALWVYNKPMQTSIENYKYKGRKEYHAFYVEQLLIKYDKEIKEINPDLFVPVPLHKKKEQKRGFNQANLVAVGLGKKLDIPVASKLLIRNKNTLPQKQLNDRERSKNLDQAFQISMKEYENYKNRLHTVILVDDIYTTGSTIEACTNVLLEYGVSEVYFISICIGKGY